MKKTLIAILVITLAFTSCMKKAESMSLTVNGFETEYLFTKDGIKVYRFKDGSHYHYFTSVGETMSTKDETVGKTSYQYQENIKSIPSKPDYL